MANVDRFHLAFRLVRDDANGYTLPELLRALAWDNSNEFFVPALQITLDMYVKDGYFIVKDGRYFRNLMNLQ